MPDFFVQHDSRRWGRTVNTRIWSLLEAFIFYLIYLASGLIAQLGLLLFHATRLAIENQQNHALFDAQVFFGDVAFAVSSRPMLVVLLSNLVVVLLYAIVIRARGERFGRYVALGAPSVRNLAGAIGAGLGLRYIFMILVALLLRESAALQEYNSHMEQIVSDNIWVVLLTVVLVAPVVEEIVFRGALFRALERSIHPWAAILIPSVLFALAHTDPVQMGYTFVLGMIFAFVRARSGKLLPCVFMHIAFNGANFLQFQSGSVWIPPFWLVLVLTAGCVALAMHRRTSARAAQ